MAIPIYIYICIIINCNIISIIAGFIPSVSVFLYSMTLNVHIQNFNNYGGVGI